MTESVKSDPQAQHSECEESTYEERHARREREFEENMAQAKRHIEAARFWNTIAILRGE